MGAVNPPNVTLDLPLSLYDLILHNVAGSSACSMFSPSPYLEFILVGKDVQIKWVSCSTRCNVHLSMCKKTLLGSRNLHQRRLWPLLVLIVIVVGGIS